MNINPDQPFIILAHPLCGWFAGLGGIAAMLPSILFAISILTMILPFRRVRRGKLKSPSTIHFSCRQ
ncbi:MAG TPA: hypothetical protein VGO57_10880 [Verrucomicrobiae bacterium]|jgi:hypothetical protein